MPRTACTRTHTGGWISVFSRTAATKRNLRKKGADICGASQAKQCQSTKRHFWFQSARAKARQWSLQFGFALAKDHHRCHGPLFLIWTMTLTLTLSSLTSTKSDPWLCYPLVMAGQSYIFWPVRTSSWCAVAFKCSLGAARHSPTYT